MNVLEKILKEMDIEVQKQRELCGGLENTPGYKLYEKAASMFKRIVMEHMGDVENTKDNWIPVSERLPEEHDSMFSKLKGTDKWNDRMYDKASDEVNVTVEYKNGTRETTTSLTVDGRWKAERNPFLKQKVIAWQPFPEVYRGNLSES